MMSKQILILIVLSLFSEQVKSQLSTRVTIVDTILLRTYDQSGTVFVGFLDDDEHTSFIQVSSTSETRTYKDMLPCYSCKEKNAPGYTYAGYSQNGNIVGFCSIDFFGVDTTYVDFAQVPPGFVKVVHQAYDKHGESYELTPNEKMSVLEYRALRGAEYEKKIKAKAIPWTYPYGTDLSLYRRNGSWLPHLIISDSVTLENGEKVYCGFDLRDWCTIILRYNRGIVRHYRNVLYEDVDKNAKNSSKLRLKSLKRPHNIILFVQSYSSFQDSIFIDFSKEKALYHRIIHVSKKDDRVDKTIIEPQVPFPIDEARTLFGDVYVFPISRKKDWLFRKY